MATILKDGMALIVGADFVDAVFLKDGSASARSHGDLEIAPARGQSGHRQMRFSWRSTLTQQATESVLREAARQEHKRVSLFISQSA